MMKRTSAVTKGAHGRGPGPTTRPVEVVLGHERATVRRTGRRFEARFRPPFAFEPYMWNVFFTVDGSTVSLRDDLQLRGQAAVTPTPGSHGNLGTGGVTAGQTIQIPDAVGRSAVVLDR